jgi:predicted ribonuclease YlaK
MYRDVGEFLLILTPTVLSELDEMKIVYRVEAVREKAEKIIRQIQEFRRRGSLVTGVPIVKGKSVLKALATEPIFSEAPAWLDRDNADDRLLASTVEILRKNPSSPVAIVTRDINLQNKADYARITTLMPDPPALNQAAK